MNQLDIFQTRRERQALHRTSTIRLLDSLFLNATVGSIICGLNLENNVRGLFIPPIKGHLKEEDYYSVNLLQCDYLEQ